MSVRTRGRRAILLLAQHATGYASVGKATPPTSADRALAEATIRRCQAEGGNLSDYLAEMIAGVREKARGGAVTG